MWAMLTVSELSSIARARLKDASALVSKGRYDGAAYVCGYAVEIALKARIVKTLKWSGFPADGGEFKDLKSFQIGCGQTLWPAVYEGRLRL